MKKILPFEIENNLVTSECWTFYRMGIIQTSTFADAWLASHINVVMNKDFNTCFGEYNESYIPTYYSDILDTKIINIFSIDSHEIVDIIKKNIDENKYSVIYTDLNFGGEQKNIHEIAIYGYDDEQEVFYSPIMTNRIFHGEMIPYKLVSQSFQQIKDNFKKEKDLRMRTTLNYQYPFTTYSLKSNYSEDLSPYAFMKKISYEMWGKKIEISQYGDFMQTYNNPENYVGIGCLCGFEKILTINIQERHWPDDFKSLVSTAKQIHEHRTIILIGLKYIQKVWNVHTDIMNGYIKSYEECCTRVQKWYYLLIKHEISPSVEILHRILDEVFVEFKQERSTLLSVEEYINWWYMENDTY